VGVGGGRGLTPLNAIPISTYSFNLEIFHSRILVVGVIDTVYTGFDFRTYLFICLRRGGHCLVGINGTNRPAVTLYYLFICSGHLCLRRERGRPVELYNACSVDIGGGRSQEGDRAGGTPASLQMHSLFI